MTQSPAPPPRHFLEYAPAPRSVRRQLARWSVTVVIILVAGALGGILVYLLQPVSYTATGVLEVNPPTNRDIIQGGYLPTDVNALAVEQRAHAASMVQLAISLHLAARITPIPDQKLITVTVLDNDGAHAIQNVNVLMDTYAPAHAGEISIAARPVMSRVARRDIVIPISGFVIGAIIASLALLIAHRRAQIRHG